MLRLSLWLVNALLLVSFTVQAGPIDQQCSGTVLRAMPKPILVNSGNPVLDVCLRAEEKYELETNDIQEIYYLGEEIESFRKRHANPIEPQPGVHIGFRYRVIRYIISGAFGRVYEAEDMKTKQKVALKLAFEAGERAAETEYESMRPVREDIHHPGHPHLTHAMAKIQTRFGLVVIYPFREGDLLDYMENTGQTKWSYEMLQEFARSMVKAVSCMASNGLTHCDIKLDNVLYYTKLPGTKSIACPIVFELTDFGLVNDIGDEIFSGTCGFIPPEVARFDAKNSRFIQQRNMAPRGPKGDIFALGTTLMQLIKEGDFSYRDSKTNIFHSPYFEQYKNRPVSDIVQDQMMMSYLALGKGPLTQQQFETLKDFIVGCLEVDPEKRLGPDDALKHPFISQNKMTINDLLDLLDIHAPNSSNDNGKPISQAI